MKSAVELHDSSVALAVATTGVLELVLEPAYIHLSAGTPGVAPGEGHVGKVILSFSDARFQGSVSGVFGRISEGELCASGVSHSLVNLPFNSATPVSLSLIFESGSTFHVEASSAQVASVGPTRYVEKFMG